MWPVLCMQLWSHVQCVTLSLRNPVLLCMLLASKFAALMPAVVAQSHESLPPRNSVAAAFAGAIAGSVAPCFWYTATTWLVAQIHEGHCKLRSFVNWMQTCNQKSKCHCCGLYAYVRTPCASRCTNRNCLVVIRILGTRNWVRSNTERAGSCLHGHNHTGGQNEARMHHSALQPTVLCQCTGCMHRHRHGLALY